MRSGAAPLRAPLGLVVAGLLIMGPPTGLVLTASAVAHDPGVSYRISSPSLSEKGLPGALSPSFVSSPDGAPATVRSISVGSHPAQIAVDSVNESLYVTNEVSSNVSEINETLGAVVRTFVVQNNPIGLALAGPGVFVANSGSDSMTLIDIAYQSVLGSFPVQGQPTGVVNDPHDGYLFVGRFGANNLTGFHTQPGFTTTAPANITVQDLPYGVAVDEYFGLVYVTNYGSDTVSVVGGETHLVLANVPVGSLPVAVAVDPATNLAYVANEGSDNLSVVNWTTSSVVRTVMVGHGPDGLAVDGVHGYAYVANSGSNNLSVLDLRSGKVLRSLVVGLTPAGVAVDQVTGRIFVANSGSNSISVIEFQDWRARPAVPLLGLSALEWYAVVGVAIAGVAALVAVVLYRRRSRSARKEPANAPSGWRASHP